MMQQVKIFKSVESEIEALQRDINAWIRESGAKVISLTGNIAPQTRSGDDMFNSSDVLVIVLYEASDS